jgi:hypothetical protein
MLLDRLEQIGSGHYAGRMPDAPKRRGMELILRAQALW